MNGEPVRVLLVEDNPADVDLMREALEVGKLDLDIDVAIDGDAALDALGAAATDARLPGLIVLDLNLPKKDGREVLAAIKSQPDTRHIPVVVLTSSEAEADVLKSYSLGANCFVKKPLDFAAFQAVVRGIESFWFTIVRLPGREGETA